MKRTPQNRKEQIFRLVIGLAVLSLIFFIGSVQGQEKKEQYPLSSSLSLQLSGYTQVLYSHTEDAVDSFLIKRARFSLSGDVFKKVRFRLQADAVKSPILLDAQVDFLFSPALDLRIGQYYVPFGRENRTSASDLETINRAQVVEKLAPSRDIGSSGRDIGVMVTGKYSVFEYMAGIFNGSGINKADTNEQKDISARLVVNPTKFLFFGGSLYNGRHSAAPGAPAVTRDRAGLEALLSYKEFTLRAEYISGKDGLVSKAGWYIQGAYFAVPKKVQALIKWDSYDQDRDALEDRSDLLTLGVNWFFTERTKLMANFALNKKQPADNFQTAIYIQFQAGF